MLSSALLPQSPECFAMWRVQASHKAASASVNAHTHAAARGILAARSAAVGSIAACSTAAAAAASRTADSSSLSHAFAARPGSMMASLQRSGVLSQTPRRHFTSLSGAAGTKPSALAAAAASPAAGGSASAACFSTASGQSGSGHSERMSSRAMLFLRPPAQVLLDIEAHALTESDPLKSISLDAYQRQFNHVLQAGMPVAELMQVFRSWQANMPQPPPLSYIRQSREQCSGCMERTAAIIPWLTESFVLRCVSFASVPLPVFFRYVYRGARTARSPHHAGAG